MAEIVVSDRPAQRSQSDRSFCGYPLELVSSRETGSSLTCRGRMLLRTIVMNDERFAMSSLAILSRSASQILSRYHEWYSSQVYNLSWQHLHHITTCANVTLFCYWRHELLKQEAEVNLNSAIWILQLAQPRWTTFAQTSRERIERVCEAFGEQYL